MNEKKKKKETENKKIWMENINEKLCNFILNYNFRDNFFFYSDSMLVLV